MATAPVALAAAATLVALAFGACTLERWLDRRRPHELAWTIALGLFAAASAALWWGSALGWGEISFRLFYALGAVINVPVLALGTVLLLARPAVGRAAAVVVALTCSAAFGALMTTPYEAELPAAGLPEGSAMFGGAPRLLAALGSGLGATVLFGGAIWSAMRLLGRRGPARLVLANGLIALGTAILSLGGVSASEDVDRFALSLIAGISVIFAGFLTASPGSRRRASRPLHHGGRTPQSVGATGPSRSPDDRRDRAWAPRRSA